MGAQKRKDKSNTVIIDEDFEMDEKIRTTYKSCMNETLLDQIGGDPLKKTLKNIGGWPVVEGGRWNATWWLAKNKSYQWYDHILMIESQRYIDPSRGIINYDIQLDPRNNSKSMFVLNNKSPNLPQKYYILTSRNRTKLYLDNMIKTATLLGASEEQAERELTESVDLETRLVRMWAATYSSSNSHGPLTNFTMCGTDQIWGPDESQHMRMDDMQKDTKYTQIDMIHKTLGNRPGYFPNWKLFFKEWLDKYGIEINGNEAVRLSSKEYLIGVATLFANSWTARPRVVANYLGWLVVEDAISKLELGKKFQAVQMKQSSLSCQSKLNSSVKCQPQWNAGVDACLRLSQAGGRSSTCARRLGFSNPQSTWSIAAGSLYVRKYINFNKQTVKDYEVYVRRAMYQLIEGAHWMGNKTKKNALTKLDSMKSYISHPDEVMDKVFMNALFKGHN